MSLSRLFIGPSRKTSHPNSALKTLTVLNARYYLFVHIFHSVITTFQRSIQEDISFKFRLEDSDGVEISASKEQVLVLIFHSVITAFQRSIQEDISSNFRPEESSGVTIDVIGSF